VIHEVASLLRTALGAKGVPYEVVYGPTAVPPKVGSTRIQILRDTDAGDQVLGPRSQHVNARQFSVRAMGAIARVHATSTLAGAQRHDHEDLADAIVDQLQIELYKIARDGKTLIRFVRAGIVTDQTADGWSGVVYELRFQIDRGVRDTKWTGAAAPEGSFTGVASTLTLDGSGQSKDLPSAATEIAS